VQDPLVLHRLPGGVGVVPFHRAEQLDRLLAEILPVPDAVVADDEGLHTGHEVLRGRRDEREARTGDATGGGKHGGRDGIPSRPLVRPARCRAAYAAARLPHRSQKRLPASIGALHWPQEPATSRALQSEQ